MSQNEIRTAAERIARAIFDGLEAFGRTAAGSLDRENGIDWRLPDDGADQAVSHLAHRETTTATATAVEVPVQSQARTVTQASAEPPPPLPPVPAQAAPAPARPRVAAQTPLAPASEIPPDGLTDEAIEAMDRETLIHFIVGRGLDRLPIFQVPPIEGRLKGRRDPTIRAWLRLVRDSGALTPPTSAVQVPPTAPPAAPPPSMQAPPPATPPPAEDVHPDVAADPGIRHKADELVSFFAEVASGGNPDCSPDMLSEFFRQRSCQGDCLRHDAVSIATCWKAVQD